MNINFKKRYINSYIEINTIYKKVSFSNNISLIFTNNIKNSLKIYSGLVKKHNHNNKIYLLNPEWICFQSNLGRIFYSFYIFSTDFCIKNNFCEGPNIRVYVNPVGVSNNELYGLYANISVREKKVNNDK